MTGGLAGLPPAAWWLGGLALGAAGLLLLRRPLAGLVRLAARTGLGLAGLAAFAPVGGLLGIGLGVNLFNGAVLGVLGLPGFDLLLMLNWLV